MPTKPKKASRSYDVRVVHKGAGMWSVPRTEQLSMNLTGAELQSFTRETFAHDPGIAKIEFRAVDKHGREIVFTRFPRGSLELPSTRELGNFREITVGGSAHRKATPQIVGTENVERYRKMFGVCLQGGSCHKIAGHEGEHS